MTDQPQPPEPTQPVQQGQPTRPVPYDQPEGQQFYGQQPTYGQQAYGQPQPPAPYGQAQPPSAYAPPPGAVEGWQPPTKPEVPLGRPVVWVIGINVVAGLLAAVGTVAILTFIVNGLAEAIEPGSRPSADERFWPIALIGGGVIFGAIAIGGSVASLIALALMRLARGFRTIGAAGQGWLAWLVGGIVSTVISVVSTPLFSFSGDSIERFVNSR